MNTWVKNREQVLQYDTNPKFLEKWKKHSKRFGKQRIFDLFHTAYLTEDLGSNNTFSFKFASIVINTLKKEKNILFFDKTTYKELMSLFGKFNHTLQKYGERLFVTMWWTFDFDVQNNKSKHSWDTSIQLSLYENLWETLQESWQKIIQQEESQQDNKIDLDALYAPDPDEPWWNK